MKRFECTQVDELMVDYLYQELGADETAAVRVHLEGCDRCAQQVRELEQTRAAARELPLLEPPAALTAQLLHQAARARRPSLRARLAEWLAPAKMYYAVAAAASLLVVVFVGYAVKHEYLKPALPAVEHLKVETAPVGGSVRTAPAAEPSPAAGDLVRAAPAAEAPPVGNVRAEVGPIGGKQGPADEDHRGGATLTLTPAPAKSRAPEGAAFPVRLDQRSLARDKSGLFDSPSNVARLEDRGARATGASGWGRGGGGAAKEKDVAAALGEQEQRFAKSPAPRHAAPRPAKRRAAAAPALDGLTRAAAPPAPKPAVNAPPLAVPQAAAETGLRGQPGPSPSGLGGLARPARKPVEQRVQPATRAEAATKLDGRVQATTSDGQRAGHAQTEEEAPPGRATRERRRPRAEPQTRDEYEAALGQRCGKMVPLLREFIRQHPDDRRVEQAKVRIAVCQAELTGDSRALDELILQNNPEARRAKARLEAQQQEQARAHKKASPAQAQRRQASKPAKAKGKAQQKAAEPAKK